jgi:hypothetical protein
MTKRHTTARRKTEGEVAACDDTRHAVYCLREFIEQVQTPERLRTAFDTLLQYRAITANDEKFGKALEEAEIIRTFIIGQIDSLTWTK